MALTMCMLHLIVLIVNAFCVVKLVPCSSKDDKFFGNDIRETSITAVQFEIYCFKFSV